MATNKWITIQSTDKGAYVLQKQSDSISAIPTITAAIAAPTPPWVMYVDLNKTLSHTVICGREGLKGVRFNGNEQIDICVYGFAIDIFRLLQQKLNFNAKIIVSRDGTYGSYDRDTNTSSGIVRDLLEQSADIGLDLIENSIRSQVLWFSKPYTVSSLTMMYVKSGAFRNAGIFKPFVTKLWFVILGSIVCVIAFVWILERFSPYGRYHTNQRSVDDDERTFNIFDSANYVWGTYFTGEIIVEKSSSFGSRATITVISIVAIIIIAAYSGNLIAFLIVVDETSPINGLFDNKVSIKMHY